MKVHNALIDKCTELCSDIARVLVNTEYAKVWEWFLHDYLGVKFVFGFNKHDYTQEQWLAAYNRLYADCRSKGLV